MLSRFHTIPACDGQTDRRTELLYQYRASVCQFSARTKLKGYGNKTEKKTIERHDHTQYQYICLNKDNRSFITTNEYVVDLLLLSICGVDLLYHAN